METAMPEILFCWICDKPFSNQVQWKRHVAYCRKTPGRTRPRSCRACNRSKIKCDFRPRCNQCVRKGIECVYDHNRASSSTQQKRLNNNINHSDNHDHTATTAIPETNVLGFSSDYSFSNPSDWELLAPARVNEFVDLTDQGYVLPHNDSTNIFAYDSFTGDALNQVQEKPGHYRPAAVYPEITLLDQSTGNNKKGHSVLKQLELKLISSLPHELSPFSTPTDLLDRNFKMNRFSTASQSYATMMIDLIRPYPQMMMRRETFPPFVHPRFGSGLCNNNNGELPFPLKNCMGIAHLFSVRNADTRPFLWSTIRAEMNGFIDKLQYLSKYDALAALEASLMYLIMRATDNKQKDPMDDTEIILIHQIVCKRAIELSEDFTAPEATVSDRKWNDWIYIESFRRVVCFWFSISLVFCIQSGIPCHAAGAYQNMPLPSTKTEWEASSEAQWKTEYTSAEVRRSQLSRFSDLLDAYRTGDSAKLNIWNAGIDNLGMLLNLAVHVLRET